MKNETICECGHPQKVHVCDARDHVDGQECPHNSWCGEDCACTAFTAAKSLRDEMFEATDNFNLKDAYHSCSIGTTVQNVWHVWTPDKLVKGGFDTPEAAFAWLKDHLKEQK